MLVCESSDCRMDYLSSPRKHRKAESEQSDNLIPRAQIVKLEPQRQIARLVEGTRPCSMYRTIRKIKSLLSWMICVIQHVLPRCNKSVWRRNTAGGRSNRIYATTRWWIECNLAKKLSSTKERWNSDLSIGKERWGVSLSSAFSPGLWKQITVLTKRTFAASEFTDLCFADTSCWQMIRCEEMVSNWIRWG